MRAKKADELTRAAMYATPSGACLDLLGVTSFPRGTIPILRQEKDWVGGVKKWPFFVDIQYCVYADIVDGWVRKSSKIC